MSEYISVIEPIVCKHRVFVIKNIINTGELKRTAEFRLGRTVSLGVMSVPAEFDEAQINATSLAAKLAGNYKVYILQCRHSYVNRAKILSKYSQLCIVFSLLI